MIRIRPIIENKFSLFFFNPIIRILQQGTRIKKISNANEARL